MLFRSLLLLGLLLAGLSPNAGWLIGGLLIVAASVVTKLFG